MYNVHCTYETNRVTSELGHPKLIFTCSFLTYRNEFDYINSIIYIEVIIVRNSHSVDEKSQLKIKSSENQSLARAESTFNYFKIERVRV